MNFQSIRNDFNQQVKEQTEALEAGQRRVHLAEELERQDRLLHARKRYSRPSHQFLLEPEPVIMSAIYLQDFARRLPQIHTTHC